MRNPSLAAFASLVSLLSLAHPALSQNGFVERDLVSDVAGRAAFTDPDLKNPWGLVPGPTGVFWASNNHTNTSTLYRADGTKVSLVVTVDGGPTGVVLADPAAPAFRIPSGDSTARAVFIFVTEEGAVAAWSNLVNPAHAIEVASTPDAGYFGAAVAVSGSGPRLYAANFHAKTVDVFDRDFHRVTLSGAFQDPGLPAGYSPFNVAAIGSRIYVAYAQLDAEGEDEVPGPGLGVVDVYDLDGRFVRRLISNGALNAPWAMVLAPPGFGAFGGKLLVGNFGDGTIHAYSLSTGAHLGALEDTNGAPIFIEGLWGLHFGRAASGADVANRLYFAAGIDGEEHGLFGYLAPEAPVACRNFAAETDDWKDLCQSGRSRHDDDDHAKRGRRTSPADSLQALFDCVASFSRPFGSGGCFTPSCDLLAKKSHRTDREKLAQEYLGLLLDRCAGLICDSTEIRCEVDEHHDHDGDNSRKRHPRVTMTVGALVAMIDTSLCATGQRDAFFERLEDLAECATESGDRRSHGHDDDDRAVRSDDGADARVLLEVAPLGGNPVRLSSALGARFVVSTSATLPVKLGIYDAAGRRIAEPLRETAVTGQLVVKWDGLDLDGRRVAPGTYFYRATTGNTVASGHVVVLR